MKITSIHYEKVFPIAPYQNEKIGIEIQVDEGDNHDDVMNEARQIVCGWSIQARFPPELLRHEPLEVKTPREFVKYDFSPPEYNIQDEKIEIQIDNCKSVEELALLKKNLPNSLMPNYMKRMKELTPKTVNV